MILQVEEEYSEFVKRCRDETARCMRRITEGEESWQDILREKIYECEKLKGEQ